MEQEKSKCHAVINQPGKSAPERCANAAVAYVDARAGSSVVATLKTGGAVCEHCAQTLSEDDLDFCDPASGIPFLL